MSKLSRFVSSLIYILAPVIFALSFAISNPVDNDFWWHIALGRDTALTGQVVTTDTYSFTAAGAPWYYSGWLPELVMYKAYDIFGYTGVQLLMTGVFLVLLLAVWKLIHNKSYAVKLLILVVVALMLLPFWTARPRTFSLVCFASSLLVLEQYVHHNRKILWLLPPIAVLWTNTHGDYLISVLLPLLYGGYMVCDVLNQHNAKYGRIFPLDMTFIHQTESHKKAVWLFVVAVLIVACWVISPIGVENYKTTLDFYRSQENAATYINEWKSPQFHNGWLFYPFLVSLVLVMTGLFLVPQKEKDATRLLDFALLVAPLLLSLLAVRAMVYYSITFALVMGRIGNFKLDIALSGANKKLVRMVPVLILLAGSALLVVGLLPYFKTETFIATEPIPMPHEAVECLKEYDLPDNYLNSYNQGGYLIYNLPSHKVFTDSRYTIFAQNGSIKDWYRIVNARDGWEELLDEYRVNTVIIEPDWPLVNHLENAPIWEKVFEEKNAVIFTRTTPLPLP